MLKSDLKFVKLMKSSEKIPKVEFKKLKVMNGKKDDVFLISLKVCFRFYSTTFISKQVRK